MKIWFTTFLCLGIIYCGIGQDWEGISIPASPGSGKTWELQTDVSDDFNYEFEATSSAAKFGEGEKWVNWYHNGWTGPRPTVWKRNNISVEDGKLTIRTTRTPGKTLTIDGKRYAETNSGCVSSTTQIHYPVYIEGSLKVLNSVMACGFWMLSPDDTKEIDICEAYGHDTRWTNPWFSNERIHLSHHVFIRQPFQDWQPHDEGSFYTDGETIWNRDFHRYGVYWRDPWHIEYYIDGKLVRVRSGKEQIDPVHYTNVVSPGNPAIDSREGLEDPMDIIIDIEDQTWRAVQGLSPTDEELFNEPEKNTLLVDWVRIYKPVEGEVGEVTAVTLDKTEVTSYINESFTLYPIITPNNALDLSVTWATDNPEVATVDENGVVTSHSVGTATITATTNENQKTATCLVTVSDEKVASGVNFDDEAKYLNTEYEVGSELIVSCDYHAGSGYEVTGGFGGVKFWLREISPGWNVVNDYTATDASAVGRESGTATATISLEDVPTTAEIPSENWYFLYITFQSTNGKTIDKGIHPINIVNSTTTNTKDVVFNTLEVFPNPTSSILNIKNVISTKDVDLQVTDTSGKAVSIPSIKRTADWMQLDINHLPKGVYLLQLTSDKIYSATFIKQ